MNGSTTEDGPRRCGFCGAEGEDVEGLVLGVDAAICGGCVALVAELFQEEPARHDVALRAHDPAALLLAAARWCHHRGWVPATSGNFSVREDAAHALVTASGRDKGRLTRDDLLRTEIVTGRVVGTAGRATTGRPSAEAELHRRRYASDADVGAVLHVHGTLATVVSRAVPPGEDVVFDGFELAKALRGVTTHACAVRLPVFENTQDIDALGDVVDAAIAEGSTTHGYLIRGHGLYTWGRDLPEARRHLEALDALMDAWWRERR